MALHWKSTIVTVILVVFALWATFARKDIPAALWFVGGGACVLAAAGTLLEPAQPGQVKQWERWTVAAVYGIGAAVLLWLSA